MHDEVLQFIAPKALALRFQHCVDLGGRNVNGNLRSLFSPVLSWTAVDHWPGDGVDIVADLRGWTPPREWDVVLCTEVLEHTSGKKEILDTAAACCTPTGVLLLSAACNPRPQHSAIDGLTLRDGEFYENVDPAWLEKELRERFHWVEVTTHPRGDIYVVATGPRRGIEDADLVDEEAA